PRLVRHSDVLGPWRASCFDRQLDVDRLLFFAQRATQFRKRNVLQLSNAFAGHAEFLSDFLERLWLSAIETEALENDFLFAVVEDVRSEERRLGKECVE